MFNIGISFAVILGLLYTLHLGDQSILNKVKSGEYELWCSIGSWEKNHKVDPSLVKSFSTDMNTWTFTNGHASSCKLTEGK